MSRLSRLGTLITVAGIGGIAAIATGCTAPDSATDLMPEGPPKVLQVMMTERITDGTTVRNVSSSWPPASTRTSRPPVTTAA